MVNLQERIAMLQQHEANDQCMGGPHCLLQSPMYNASVSAMDPMLQVHNTVLPFFVRVSFFFSTVWYTFG